MSQSTSAESNGKELVQGITRISVRGYKSLYEECSIEIRPLTILAGANSSGKSSIMQPLLLMKQTLEVTYDPGALLLNGPNLQFTLAKQLFSHSSSRSYNNSFTTQIEIENNKAVTNTFQKPQSQKIKIIEAIYKIENEEVMLLPKMTHEEIVGILPERLEKHYKLVSRLFKDEFRWKVSRIRCFLDFYLDGRLNPRFFASPFEKHVRNLIHIPGLRGNPERTYPITAVSNKFSGTFESYVASIVNHWKKAGGRQLKDLESNLEALGLTDKIEARQVNDVQIELRVSRLPGSDDASDMVSIADVGLGVSQVLPVLVALLAAEPGQLVYLEQPEIHLHPRAQAALAEILADAANRGVRVVVETHSDLLLKRIQSLVAEDKISEDKVKLHWFRRGEDGVTRVSSADLTDAGAFGNWPEDFGDVALKEESRYLDAAFLKLQRQ